MIFRRVYDDLKKNHIDKFFDDFPGLFQFYRASDHELILPAEEGKVPSRIIFSYAETESEIRRKFHGPEYMDMFVDQAEQLTETELKTMKTAVRWPGMADHMCKLVMFFNPGGKGISFFKRVFREKKYRDKERARDFEFIQAYGWDNVEWARSAMMDDGYGPVCQDTDDCPCLSCTFYSWTNDERFEYFLNRSQYGQDLNTLPPAMRIGHLMGSLDTFAGQYFDNFNEAIHVRHPEVLEIEPWHPKWISIDYGYHHPSAVLWHAQDGTLTKTYREIVKSGLGPRALAQEIADACINRIDPNETDKIDAVYLSPDAFAKRTTEDPIAKQIGEVLRFRGLPYPRKADDDRVGGWMLMREMLQYNRWVISSECPELIKTLPIFSRDEKEPEDCVKFDATEGQKDGDDVGDSARYGLKSRFPSRQAPREVQLHQFIESVRAPMVRADRNQAAINTAMHMAHLKFNADFAKKNELVRIIRRGRGMR